ncbi:hypothetical protein [uncultured Winogradskyella sp.]|uniref:hypothetical protein n=1 Tax=Winogradskyella sp. 4-2091 TaxID=3381659 RepID=UPI002608BEA2|nr:hypothetical protein [uncultured Winogradskyella sp.]
MKKILLALSCIVIFSCSNTDDNNNCNFLLDVGVNLTVNTNFPQFSQLQFTGNAVYVSGYGNSGIWLYRASTSILYAWDAADPGLVPSSCTTLVSTGVGDIVENNCNDANQFSLATGVGFNNNSHSCTLLPYRVENIGNNTYLVSN